jgi:hypothetical protein
MTKQAMRRSSKSKGFARLTFQWILSKRTILLAFLLYFPLVFLGYGSDVDSYRVVEAGKNFFRSADYVPSRNPGYVVHEMMSFFLNAVGGSWLSNLGTMLMALAAVIFFLKLCRHYQIPNENTLALVMIVHPLFWINAASTIDYIWAIGFLLIGFYLLTQMKYLYAGLAFGLAIGSRLGTFIVIIFILGVFLWQEKHDHLKLLQVALVTGLVSAAAYILPFDFTEWQLRILSPSLGDRIQWTFPMRAGRFFYKNLYFWGLAAALVLVYIFLIRGKALIEGMRGRYSSLSIIAILSIVGTEILYFRYPIALEYLLVCLPFWLFLVGILLRDRKRVLLILILAVLVLNFVNVNIARPDLPNQAKSANFGLWIEKGYLVDNIQSRIELLGCETRACYAERTNASP